MEDKWNKIYTENEIRKIQKIELYSFKIYIKTRKRVVIDFMLHNGIRLGASKYKGFRPCNDDLDLVLMRKNYNMLIEVGHKT